MHRAWRLPIVGLTLALLLVAALPASDAAAHAVLLRSIPSSSQTLAQSPAEVRLLFSEPLDPKFSGVRLLDATGNAVDSGDSRVDPDDDRQLVVSVPAGLPNGVYSVYWRSFSVIDVHPDDGRFPLYVGVPVPTNAQAATVTGESSSTTATTISRWWFYISASLFGGVLFGWKLFMSPALRDASQETRRRVRKRVYRVLIVGAGVFIVGTLYAAVAQAAAAANVPLQDAFGQPLLDLLGRGRYASIWWPRLAFEIAAALVIIFGGIEGMASEVALALLPAVLLTTSMTSHGAAATPSALVGTVVDWAHLLSASAWVGGLIGLLLVVPLLLRGSSEVPLVPTMVAGFSRYALIAVALLAVSGVAQAVIEVGSWNALLTSTYGALVLVKIVLLVAILALAVLNRRLGFATGSSAKKFGRGVMAELALGVVVLAVAAVLTGTPPARTASPSTPGTPPSVADVAR